MLSGPIVHCNSSAIHSAKGCGRPESFITQPGRGEKSKAQIDRLLWTTARQQRCVPARRAVKVSRTNGKEDSSGQTGSGRTDVCFCLCPLMDVVTNDCFSSDSLCSRWALQTSPGGAVQILGSTSTTPRSCRVDAAPLICRDSGAACQAKVQTTPVTL